MSNRAPQPPAYDRLARFYEWEHHDFRDDLPLYLGLARASIGPILDAACGTGRVLLPLLQAGHTVTGADLSERMLDIARAALERSEASARARLERADLRTMELGQRHGMALVALGSFHHLLTTEDQRRALGRLSDHLVRGGLLVLDLVNPSPEWLAAGDGTMVHQRSAPFPTAEGPDMLSKFVVRTTHFETQREQLLLIYDRVGPGGALRRQIVPLETRLLFRFEAELLLAQAGFRLRDVYGDYDLGSYQASSPRMIFVAEKA